MPERKQYMTGGDHLKTTDWKYDFPTLPRWENHYDMHVQDEYYELSQTDTLCCIYSIAEVRMCDDWGFLAILQNKKNPKLVLNALEGINFRGNISVSSGEDLIFLKATVSSNNMRSYPIIIVDVVKKRFSYINTNNGNPFFDVIQTDESTFTIKADEYQCRYDPRLSELSKKIIKREHLRWYKFSKFRKLPSIILQKRL